MTPFEMLAMIEFLKNAIESRAFSENSPCELLLGEYSIKTEKLPDGYVWGIKMPTLTAASPSTYDTIEDAQAGLKKALTDEIARLFDAGAMPHATNE